LINQSQKVQKSQITDIDQINHRSRNAEPLVISIHETNTVVKFGFMTQNIEYFYYPDNAEIQKVQIKHCWFCGKKHTRHLYQINIVGLIWVVSLFDTITS